MIIDPQIGAVRFAMSTAARASTTKPVPSKSALFTMATEERCNLLFATLDALASWVFVLFQALSSRIKTGRVASACSEDLCGIFYLAKESAARFDARCPAT